MSAKSMPRLVAVPPARKPAFWRENGRSLPPFPVARSTDGKPVRWPFAVRVAVLTAGGLLGWALVAGLGVLTLSAFT